MTIEFLLLLTVAITAVAFLYSSVGHAGASGYIAIMSLFGLAPATIKPTALILNIFVACLSTYNFWRAGYFSWSLFWPFAILSIPFAFLGGYLNLPTPIFKVVVGVILLFSALRLLWSAGADGAPRHPSRAVAIAIGGGLGLLAGLTGTGGGIFLTPLLLFLGWAQAKQAAAVSALFILVNSVSGLIGNYRSAQNIPGFVYYLLAGVIVGGALGSYLGSQRFPQTVIKRLLAVVLIIAGIKLITTI